MSTEAWLASRMVLFVAYIAAFWALISLAYSQRSSAPVFKALLWGFVALVWVERIVAWYRSPGLRALDAMLRHAAPPIQRGVMRGSHEYFNRLDAERQKQAARALNAQ